MVGQRQRSVAELGRGGGELDRRRRRRRGTRRPSGRAARHRERHGRPASSPVPGRAQRGRRLGDERGGEPAHQARCGTTPARAERKTTDVAAVGQHQLEVVAAQRAAASTSGPRPATPRGSSRPRRRRPRTGMPSSPARDRHRPRPVQRLAGPLHRSLGERRQHRPPLRHPRAAVDLEHPQQRLGAGRSAHLPHRLGEPPAALLLGPPRAAPAGHRPPAPAPPPSAAATPPARAARPASA